MQKAVFLFLFGVLFFAGGLIVILFFASENIFQCTRVSGDNGTCQYIQKTIMNTKTIDFQLNNIKEARVKESGGSRRSYSVELYTVDNNTLSITGQNSSTGNSATTAYADQINTFLTNTDQKDLNLVQDERMIKYILGTIFALAGIVMTLSGVFSFIKARS